MSLPRAAFKQGCFGSFFFGWKVSAVGVILNLRSKLKTDQQELPPKQICSFPSDSLFLARPGISSKLHSQPGKCPWGAAAPALSLPVRLLATYLLSTFSVDAATCSQGMQRCYILILSMYWDFKAHLVGAWNNGYKHIHLWQTAFDISSAGVIPELGVHTHES